MLRSLKAVDLYRKAAVDIKQSTASGGLLSLISYIVIIILLCSEVNSYFLSAPVPKLLVEPHSD